MILTDQQIAPIDMQARRKSDFSVGDTVRVHQKITEKDKIRTQVFEGTVIARKHGTEPGATFTVRRVGTDEIAVEKIFPFYSPMIERIETTRKVKTRRAKLYFLRGRTPRQIREKLRKALHLPESKSEEQPEQKEESPTPSATTDTETPEEKTQQDKPANEKAESEQQTEEEKPAQEQPKKEDGPENTEPAQEQPEPQKEAEPPKDSPET